MHSFAYSADRSATPIAHCFSPSDLMPLVRAHTERPDHKGMLGARDGLSNAHADTCFQGLLFYLSVDKSQAAHQLGAICGLMQELYLRSLPRVPATGE